MPRAKTNGIEIEYETFGPPSGAPLLLIMGLGAQMLQWHEHICELLVEGGCYVIRFDNRDCGLSSKIDATGFPRYGEVIEALRRGEKIDVAYTLSDMAADAAGLLDLLGMESAHVCGASLGGMIAQTVAIEHPGRVRSLVSLESTTSNPKLPPLEPRGAEALFSLPPNEREPYIEYHVRTARLMSGDFHDDDWSREMATRSYDRGIFPEGSERQAVAALVSGDRTERLRSVRAPTLVVHGSSDPIFPLEHAHAVVAAVPGAKLRVVEGWGHGLVPQVWGEIVEAILGHVRAAEGSLEAGHKSHK